MNDGFAVVMKASFAAAGMERCEWLIVMVILMVMLIEELYWLTVVFVEGAVTDIVAVVVRAVDGFVMEGQQWNSDEIAMRDLEIAKLHPGRYLQRKPVRDVG